MRFLLLALLMVLPSFAFGRDEEKFQAYQERKKARYEYAMKIRHEEALWQRRQRLYRLEQARWNAHNNAYRARFPDTRYPYYNTGSPVFYFRYNRFNYPPFVGKPLYRGLYSEGSYLRIGN